MNSIEIFCCNTKSLMNWDVDLGIFPSACTPPMSKGYVMQGCTLQRASSLFVDVFHILNTETQKKSNSLQSFFILLMPVLEPATRFEGERADDVVFMVVDRVNAGTDDDAFGEASLSNQLSKDHGGARVSLGRLENKSVTSDGGDGNAPKGDHGWEVCGTHPVSIGQKHSIVNMKYNVLKGQIAATTPNGSR